MDEIQKLPTDDKYKNTPQELKVLSQYFEKPEAGSKLLIEVKDVLIASVIFLVLANPITEWILDYVPHMGSPLIRTLGKVVFFAIILYVTLLIVKK